MVRAPLRLRDELRFDRMTGRPALLVAFLVVLLPALLAPVLVRPKVGLLLVLVSLLALLAINSVAYPIALAGVPALVIAYMKTSPFPRGSVVALLVASAGLAIAFGLFRGNVRLPFGTLMSVPVLASTSLALVMLIRLNGSAEPGYGSLKTKLFILQNLLFLIAGLLIAQRRRNLDIYLVLSLAIAGISGMLVIYRLVSGEAQAVFDSRFTLTSQGGPIQFGRQSAEGLIIGVYALLAARAGLLRALALCLTPILGIALIAAGSRGPVLGGVVGLVVLIALGLNDPAIRRRLLLLTACGVATALLIPQLLPSQSINRSLSFLIGSGSGISSNGRYALWSEAYSQFAHHPLFGIGTGSFFAVDGVEHYPHNLLLEVAAELGAVGLLLLLAFLFASVLRLGRAWRTAAVDDRLRVAVVAALFAAASTNALFSADIQDNASVWLAAGLAIGLTLAPVRESNEPEAQGPLRNESRAP